MHKYNTNIESTRNNMVENQSIGQNPYINQNNMSNINNIPTNIPQQNQNLLGNDFVKGALIGAAVTFLLTNKKAQSTIMDAVSKGNEFFQAGMEEIKERYEDIKAQRESNEES